MMEGIFCAFAAALIIVELTVVIRAVLRLRPIEALILVSLLAELVKKLLYILSAGEFGKTTSLVLSTPLMMAVIEIVRSGISRMWFYQFGLPAVLLGGWLLLMIVFTVISPTGSILALTYNSVVILWVFGVITVSRVKGLAPVRRNGLMLLLLLAVFIGGYNIFVDIDPLWTAYAKAAGEVSIGANFLADKGYSGSIFSSPSEYGLFVMAALTWILAVGNLRGKTFLPALVVISVLGAITTGSRYILIGILLIWVFYLLLKVVRIRPIFLMLLFCLFSIAQDYLGQWLLSSDLSHLSSQYETTFGRRLTTVGTLGARVGFKDALGDVVRQYGLRGVGSMDNWGRALAYLPDDRHSIILRIIIQTGIAGLLLFLGFIWWHYKLFYRVYREGDIVGRVGIAYLNASLLMSLGGPQANGAWFFLTLGSLAGLALTTDMRQQQMGGKFKISDSYTGF